MKNVKNPTTGKTDPQVLQVTDNLITGATGKPELANAPVSLGDITTQREEAATATTEEAQARDAWLTKRATREATYRTLRTSVKRFALHANSVYAGEKVALQALGLTVIENAGVVGVLPAPTNLRSRPGKLNQSIDLLWNSVRGRQSHELQCAESAAGPWNEVYRGKKTRASCTALVSGKEYFFRLRAWGTAGPGTWSDITSTRAS